MDSLCCGPAMGLARTTGWSHAGNCVCGAATPQDQIDRDHLSFVFLPLEEKRGRRGRRSRRQSKDNLRAHAAIFTRRSHVRSVSQRHKGLPLLSAVVAPSHRL